MWSLWRFLDVSVMRALGAFIFGLLGVMAAGWVVLLPVEWLEDDLRGRRLWFCAGGSRGGLICSGTNSGSGSGVVRE